jgi:hypothetical protein
MRRIERVDHSSALSARTTATYRSNQSMSDLGNLAADVHPTHTSSTYHRTWETGLGSGIRVAGFSPELIRTEDFRTKVRGLLCSPHPEADSRRATVESVCSSPPQPLFYLKRGAISWVDASDTILGRVVVNPIFLLTPDFARRRFCPNHLPPEGGLVSGPIRSAWLSFSTNSSYCGWLSFSA